MSVEAKENAIYEFIRVGLKAAGRTEAIGYPNMPFDPPKGSAFIRLTITESNTGNPAVGGEWKRTDGLVIAQVCVPLNTGNSYAAICDVLLDIMENKKTGQFITFSRGTVFNDGATSDEAWWQSRVVVPYRYEEKT